MKGLYKKHLIYKGYSIQSSKQMANDEDQKDTACFLAQQALEFLMKFVLGQYGIAYPKTHNIRTLLELLDTTDFVFDKHDELDTLADTITSWEAKARYADGVFTTLQTLNKVYKIMDSINDAWKEIDLKNLDVF